MEFSEIAGASSARGTSSGVSDPKAGKPSAEPRASAAVRTSRSAGVVTCASVMVPSAPARSNCHTWLASTTLRRSSTSASAPAGSASTKFGAELAVCSSATSAAEVVSEVISQEAATRCIHEPTFDASDASHSPGTRGCAVEPTGSQRAGGRFALCRPRRLQHVFRRGRVLTFSCHWQHAELMWSLR